MKLVTDLVDYGIQNEGSDVRVHVCPTVRRVYVYRTCYGVEVIRMGNHRKVAGYQVGVEQATAEGYLVPPCDIPKCIEINFLRDSAWEYMQFSKEESTSVKGAKAVTLVKNMIKQGLFPFSLNGSEVEVIHDPTEQKAGVDIIVVWLPRSNEQVRIQVKCDFDGGDKQLGGTGNLFLQVAELNPNGYY